MMMKKAIYISSAAGVVLLCVAGAVSAGTLDHILTLRTYLRTESHALDEVAQAARFSATTVLTRTEAGCPLATDRLSMTSSDCETEGAFLEYYDDVSTLAVVANSGVVAVGTSGELVLGDIAGDPVISGAGILALDGDAIPRAWFTAMPSGGGGEENGRVANMQVFDGSGEETGVVRASVSTVTQPDGTPTTRMEVNNDEQSEAASVTVTEDSGTAVIALNNAAAGSSITLQSDGDIVLTFGN